MPNNKQDDNNIKNTSTYLKFTGMAFQMIAIIGIFTYAGYKADEFAGHQVKWVTAVLSLIGVFVSIYVVIKSLKE